MTSSGGCDTVLKTMIKGLLEQGNLNIKYDRIKLLPNPISSYFALYFKPKSYRI